MAKKNRIPHKFLPWIDVRKKFNLSHAHVQMARELGLNPKRFSSYANCKEQPWKLPLPQYIEALYEKSFGKNLPDNVLSIEQMAAHHLAKRKAKKAAKAALEAGRDESKISEESSNDPI
ncbi:hypothetical protein CA13_52140 [Planctomycetes bacterium CA13]|uniref:Uncharacterized protein n=1 Tax=Novipirellula herctigrandis TaxID=2527986 RepID=A0A5C5Z9G9_9BACT|nr:hypothetical protein CA13_52140 [Planctomycetes bacterium CA13]